MDQTFSAVTCPICNSNKSKPFLTAPCIRRNISKEYCLYKCPQCLACFVYPTPNAEELATIYENDYESEWENGRSLKQRVEHYLVKNFPIPPSARIVDIGCGSGAYVRHLRTQGYDAVGVDPFIEQYGAQIDTGMIRGNIAEAHFQDSSFDIATMWWVIEHYYNPLQELQEVHRILKHDGILAISTCNIDSIEAKLFGKYWHHLVLPEHLFHFTPQSLSILLDKAGFKIESIYNIPITNGFSGSFHWMMKALGFNSHLNNIVGACFGIPFELICASIAKSGLFRILARPV